MPDQQPNSPSQPLPSVFLTVWDEAWAAITKPAAYVAWAKQPVSRSIAYMALISFVLAVVSTAYLLIMGGQRLESAKQWLVANVPPITIKDGVMQVQEHKPLTYTDDRTFFFRIDDSQELKDVHIDAFYEDGAYLAKDGLYVRSGESSLSNTYQELGLANESVTGQSLADNLTWLAKILLVILPLFILIGGLLGHIAYAFLFALIAWLVSGMKVPLTHLFNMALYALTPSLLVSYLLFLIYPIDIIPSLVFIIYYSLAINQYRRS